MTIYLIERTVPGAGGMDQATLEEISRQSNGVLAEMGPGITWLHSYVAGDKIMCIYDAENEELLREHGRRGGFPVDSVTPVSARIEPATGG